ncbi:glycosyltransferase family 1 protein [Sphingomonas sp. ASV193]|uniref:glycosyltransferase family 4 protein n=1 Tax=Sphingomonas sp. ASV193 TaxID=3144405 RepID=UPI0032E8A122
MSAPRRIGLNATCFNDRPSGARQRFIGLYSALMARRPDDRFIVYEPADCRVARWFERPNVEARPTPLPSDRRWPRFLGGLAYWQGALATDRLDLFEQFNLPGAFGARCPTVMTVHDFDSDRSGPLQRRVERLVFAPLVRRADVALAVSDQVADALRRRVPGQRVERIHNGIDLTAWPLAPAAARRPFLLAVGHLEARKNYARLIAAFARLRARHPDLALRIVGRDSGERATLDALIERLSLGNSVVIESGLDDAEVRALYATCLGFIFPSLFEGFGIPLLEAMASGAPMAISDLPVFREIVGEAALMFDPTDEETIAASLERLVGDAPVRVTLAGDGRARAEQFDYDRLALELAALHDRLLEPRAMRVGDER